MLHALCSMLFAIVAVAQPKPSAPENGFAAMGLKSPKTILENSRSDKGFFGNRFDGEVKELGSESPDKVDPAVAEQAQPAAQEVVAAPVITQKDEAELKEEAKRKILNRVDKDAPAAFQDMVYNFRTGDSAGARQSAAGYVDYLTDLMFELRIYTQMIGEAFIERKMIEEDDWVGVEGILNWTMATSRIDSGNPLKMTHEAAMKRIKPDPNNQVEVYYFFSLSSKYSREMAADVERLWQSVKHDKNVKMAGVTIGSVPGAWMQSYRDFTGLTLPIYNGEELAKKFRVALVPAVVVVSKTSNTAYLKTGQQDFKRLYEFVRTAQGLPIELTPALQRLATAPVGSLQSASGKVRVATVEKTHAASVRSAPRSASMEKF